MTDVLWHSRDIAAAIGASPSADFDVFGICFDSREVQPGDLFIALKGENSDGHKYLAQVFDHGAAGAIVSERPEGLDAWHDRLLVVNDSFKALNALAKAARERSSAKVIAVTGSAGKTSTKEALRDALSRCGKTHASIKSFNNHVGVPISLVRMPADCDFAVFELGMSAPGEIATLSQLVKPDVAIITAIGGAHHQAFDDLGAIADAKAEIVLGLTKGGALILPKAIKHKDRILAAAKKSGVKKIIETAKDGQADVHVLHAFMGPEASCLRVQVADFDMVLKIGIPGEHWVDNALNVLAAAHHVGGDVALAGISLANLRPVSGRGRRHQMLIDEVHFTLIDDSYNANPLSVEASLKVLSTIKPEGKFGARIAVLGDMEELGDKAEALHLGLQVALRDAGVNRLYTVGKHMRTLAQALSGEMRTESFSDLKVLRDRILRTVRPGDVLLVKGSNAQHLDKLVRDLRDMNEIEPEFDDYLDRVAAE